MCVLIIFLFKYILSIFDCHTILYLRVIKFRIQNAN